MRVLRGLRGPARPPRRTVVTVGVFDGVHRAHERLILAAVRLAHDRQGTSVAVTFDPDPAVVLHPAQAHPALMPLEARLARLRSLGVDAVWILPFTKRFSRMRARRFVEEVLLRRLRATALIVGETFAFGRHRTGHLAMLRAVGRTRGMQVIPLREVRQGGAPISSSRIRGLIARGRLAQARRLLGSVPTLYGVVVPGAGRGRRLGVPTANLRMRSDVLPPHGVYAVAVHDPARPQRRWRGVPPHPSGVRGTRTAGRSPLAFGKPLGCGVMNLGVRPTFGPGPVVCEVHLVNFSGTLLGRSVAVGLLGRLRGERCFASPAALVRQIRLDLRRARRLFRRSA